jgi:hypothetical protein
MARQSARRTHWRLHLKLFIAWLLVEEQGGNDPSRCVFVHVWAGMLSAAVQYSKPLTASDKRSDGVLMRNQHHRKAGSPVQPADFFSSNEVHMEHTTDFNATAAHELRTNAM